MTEKVMGRPTIYNEQIAEEICTAIATSSIGLKRLCDMHDHWPDKQSIYNWLYKYPNFFDQYIKAKEAQMLIYAEETIEIADDKSHDVIIREGKDGETYEVANNEFINRSRLRVDTRKWHISKLMPKIYGDKQVVENNHKFHEDDLKALK